MHPSLTALREALQHAEKLAQELGGALKSAGANTALRRTARSTEFSAEKQRLILENASMAFEAALMAKLTETTKTEAPKASKK
jgi:predicted DsbA family dithiol-disulfide isomerase